MEIIKTPLEGLLVIKPKVFEDKRGYFYEAYNKNKFHQAGLNYDFVQDNESKSVFGVLRGLHYQKAPYAQTKLVRVINGRVWDVAVDIRKGSPTFGQWYGIELSEENKLQMLVPEGFAHGFAVLSKNAVFAYKCDNLYHKDSERGIKFDDSEIGIDWKLEKQDVILSEKDSKNPILAMSDNNFVFNLL